MASMPHLLSRAATAVTGLALIGASLTACADDTIGEEPAPTPATTTAALATASSEPSPSNTFDDAEVSAIEAATRAVEDYEAVVNELSRNPTPDAAALNEAFWAVADVNIAARESDAVLGLSEDAVRLTGETAVLNLTPLEVNVDESPATVRVSYCLDRRSIGAVDADGNSALPADSPDLLPSTATVSQLPSAELPEFPSGWVVTEQSNAFYAQIDEWTPPEEDPCELLQTFPLQSFAHGPPSVATY